MGSSARLKQEQLVKMLREVYGQHHCNESKVITKAQLNDDKSPINDCLGHPNGNLIDNIEDVDTVVGWLAEFRRPHGFDELQKVVNVFDPWARDRGEYYSLQWKARPGAEEDEAFTNNRR
jgi:hypothetical protein